MSEKKGLRGKIELIVSDNQECRIVFSGSWTIYSRHEEVFPKIKGLISTKPIKRIQISQKGLSSWDSLFVSLIERILNFLDSKGIETEILDLPEGVKRLLELSKTEVNKKKTLEKGMPLFEIIGETSLSVFSSIISFQEFLGRITIAILNIFLGRSRLRYSDFLLYTQNAGARALPIVSLVSFLVGLILAFVATVQLKLFGAQIFVADLVGIAMARDIGAMMCGIIMAGRTGATYAAQIGTMQVNEEIDALRTFGFDPIEFLVVPRLFALTLMMPLLCIYSDLLGIAGGAVVGAGFTDITLLQYITETKNAVPLTHFSIGIFKAFVYGIIVAIIGCRKGLTCGRSAASVGRVTTSAVVTSIVWIILSCALITYICYVYDI